MAELSTIIHFFIPPFHFFISSSSKRVCFPLPIAIYGVLTIFSSIGCLNFWLHLITFLYCNNTFHNPPSPKKKPPKNIQICVLRSCFPEIHFFKRCVYKKIGLYQPQPTRITAVLRECLLSCFLNFDVIPKNSFYFVLRTRKTNSQITFASWLLLTYFFHVVDHSIMLCIVLLTSISPRDFYDFRNTAQVLHN